ncbi:hypothetical protein COY34_01585 [candidate division WWE3 bacterium CG_4_10_14_0_2_um_filter_42_8]|uniref:Rad50/SbcC-type AAA domain-containing protein n=1 Tax=candidate division WWE3 bacterium CG_4_10_14_0_2_um_filter_42_8 TaxID=1975074 RepID=A0A2M7TCK3_UNCKA|nr:MAG: hypothetical protein COY34_01585 [candidate division WWE3 bacterium CG_4_10_14_0_2_um_filter_42_8]
MIPEKLSLKNFTSYGDDNPPLDLSRMHLTCLSGPNGAGKSSLLDAFTYAVWGEARGKSPDDLVRLGQNLMEVEFEFRLDKACYRIQRARNLKRGLSELSLFSKTAKGKQWSNLTEGTIKETQTRLDQILKTSYETFVNSAFLRQGRADEFTLKGPTERKKILSEILGLQIYDELEEKAKENAKARGQEILRLETQLGEIENELGQAEIRQMQLKQAEEKVLGLEQKLAETEQQIKLLTETKEVLLIEKASREQLEKSINRQKRELSERLIQKKKKEEQILRLKSTLTRKDEIEKKYALKMSLQKTNDELNEKQSVLIKLIAQKSGLESQLQSKQAQNEQEIAKLLVQCQNLKQEGLNLNEQIAKTKDSQKRCPLCGNPLGLEQQQDVLKKLNLEHDQKLNLYQKHRMQIQKLQATKFENEPLLKIQEMIKKNDYDEEKHRLVKSRLLQLKGVEEEKTTLETVGATLKSEAENLKAQEESMGEVQKTLAEEQQAFAQTRDVALEIAENQKLLAEKTLAQKSLLAEERGARAILGEAKGLVSRSEQLSGLRLQKMAERDFFSQEKNNYEELSLAFGKKGIQAMLIETAIPEIEEETNHLLDRLTDGRLRVTLQTQKDTKKGDTVETLEIVIADELGSRAYEMYSGGEAFRVNFALRLALSKLLTQRAGTKLQFLVIDEGFGTQDTQGRERLVEVINEIKDDFEKILVVTHLDELKELFPVRIEVEKKTDGSHYNLVGI